MIKNPTRSATWATVITAATRAALSDAHFAIPGRVTRYDASQQQADVQPLIKLAYIDEGGARQVDLLPVVTNVPVQFPGSGDYTITFPIKADSAGNSDGDTVLLIFSEASLDVWLTTDGEVDPADDRRCNLSDAICVPGLRSFANPRTNPAPASAAMTLSAGGPTITLDSAKIKMAGGGTPIALKGHTSAPSAALKTWAAAMETGLSGVGGVAPVPNFATAVTTVGAINQGSSDIEGA